MHAPSRDQRVSLYCITYRVLSSLARPRLRIHHQTHLFRAQATTTRCCYLIASALPQESRCTRAVSSSGLVEIPSISCTSVSVRLNQILSISLRCTHHMEDEEVKWDAVLMPQAFCVPHVETGVSETKIRDQDLLVVTTQE